MTFTAPLIPSEYEEESCRNLFDIWGGFVAGNTCFRCTDGTPEKYLLIADGFSGDLGEEELNGEFIMYQNPSSACGWASDDDIGPVKELWIMTFGVRLEARGETVTDNFYNYGFQSFGTGKCLELRVLPELDQNIGPFNDPVWPPSIYITPL